MKLLVVAPYFYPKIGGLEKYAWEITKGLKNNHGWDIVVITSNHEGITYREDLVEGVKIYRLPTAFKISNTPINFSWPFTIRSIIKKEKPDIINAHSPVPFIADITRLVSGKIPFVLTYHSGNMLKGNLLIDVIISLYQKTCLRMLFEKSSAIITYSDFVKKVASHRIYKIHPGVDTKLFKPSNTKKNTNILFVGRIERSSHWKGITYLIDAYSIIKKKHPTYSLIFVGSGDGVSDYKDLVKNKGLQNDIHFVGEKHNNDLVTYYQDATCLVLPSTSNAESFGIVLIEAMATGTPVIGSNIGGIPNVIQDKKNGLLCNPRDVYDLASKIMQLIEDKKLYKNIQSNGIEYVKQYYSWENNIARTNKLLSSLL